MQIIFSDVFNLQSNSMDPNQNTPYGAIWSGSHTVYVKAEAA